MSPRQISLAYSTDSDDAFMFWALRPGAERIDTRGFVFTHERADTHTLNMAARAGRNEDRGAGHQCAGACCDTLGVRPCCGFRRSR